MKIKKIIAGVAGFVLIALLLLFVNAWVGNPISKMLAKQGAVKYVEEKYSDLNLEMGKVYYNFKFGTYGVFVQSSKSKDTAFSIHMDGYGNVKRDDYEYEVANNFTTWRRLSEELDKKAVEIIGRALEYDFEHISIRFAEQNDDDKGLMKLSLDMELDIYNPPLPLEAYVNIYSEDVSYNKIAEVAKSVEDVMSKQGVPVSQYSVRLIPEENKPEKENMSGSWVNSISVSNFPAEMMAEDNLPQTMEQFENTRIVELEKKYPK